MYRCCRYEWVDESVGLSGSFHTCRASGRLSWASLTEMWWLHGEQCLQCVANASKQQSKRLSEHGKRRKNAGALPGKEAVWSRCWKFWDGCLNLVAISDTYPNMQNARLLADNKKKKSARLHLTAEWQNVLEVWWNLGVSYERLWAATRRLKTITPACLSAEEMFSVFGQFIM